MKSFTEKEKKAARICLDCPICRRARKKQKGLAYLFVKKVEHGMCPKCQAYEKVYGKKAYEP